MIHARPRLRCFARLAPALAIPLAACAADAPQDGGAVVRDSAGVRIVASGAPAWAGSAGWTVEPEPAVSIGVQDGDEAYQFFYVHDAVRLDDGRILVTDAGAGELRFYDAAGQHLRSVGRHGGGPGEFAAHSSMHVCRLPGDTALVEDRGQGRVHLFTLRGEFVRSVRIEPPARGGRPPWVDDCFGDGSWLAGIAHGAIQAAPGEITSNSFEYFWYRPDGSAGSSLVEYEGRPRFVNQVGGIIMHPYIPLTPALSLAGAHDRVYFTLSGAPEIERRTKDGCVELRIRWSPAGRVRSADVYDRYGEESLASMSEDMRVRYARLLAQDLPIPEYVPTTTRLLVDAAGNLWAERFRLPWDAERGWEVFDSGGRWLGTVVMPPRFSPYDIGADYVLGRHIDELGVQRVRLHRLLHGSGGAR